LGVDRRGLGFRRSAGGHGSVRRAEIWSFLGRGDFSGKPRPGLIVQSDLFNGRHPSVTVCPISTAMTDDRMYRVGLQPDPSNNLNRYSEVEVDKVQAVWLSRLGRKIGLASDEQMQAVDDALRLWLDL
jgi:mRNA interferase MazF